MLEIENLTTIALGLMMVGMGLSLETDDFKKLLISPKHVVIGVLAQMVGLPILGLAIAVLFGVPPTMAVGIMILVSCAGGVVSGLLTQLADGDVALSISMTSISMLIGTITIPIVINQSLQHFLSHTDYVEIDLLNTSLRLISITVLPVLVGMLLKTKFPNFSNRYQPSIARGSYTLLIIIIFMTIFASGGEILDEISLLFAPLLLLNCLAMLMGYAIARATNLGAETSKTLTIEVGIQNSATGIFIATSLLLNPQFAVPSLVYTGIAFVNTGLFIASLRMRSCYARI